MHSVMWERTIVSVRIVRLANVKREYHFRMRYAKHFFFYMSNSIVVKYIVP